MYEFSLINPILSRISCFPNTKQRQQTLTHPLQVCVLVTATTTTIRPSLANSPTHPPTTTTISTLTTTYHVSQVSTPPLHHPRRPQHLTTTTLQQAQATSPINCRKQALHPLLLSRPRRPRTPEARPTLRPITPRWTMRTVRPVTLYSRTAPLICLMLIRTQMKRASMATGRLLRTIRTLRIHSGVRGVI